MTTESTHTRRPGVTVLLGAAAVATAACGVLVVAGALLAGSAAAYGALVGAGLALVVFLGGALAVDAVAARVPAASLLVALLTYTLEVVVMAVVFVALSGSGLLGETLARGWLGAGVIATTLVWLLAQVALSSRVRIPVYDLPAGEAPATGPERTEADAR
jgi:ATP synthase protein I